MNTKLVMAVNEVEYLDGRKKAYAKPGRIFPLDSSKVEKLIKMGAVREPTDSEMALYEKQNKTVARKAAKSDDSGDSGDSGDNGQDAKRGKTIRGKAKREEAPV